MSGPSTELGDAVPRGESNFYYVLIFKYVVFIVGYMFLYLKKKCVRDKREAN